MEEKFYTKYDNECIFYLGLQIMKQLLLEQRFMYIDLYYEEVIKIYEDYKKEDSGEMSLLDSINTFIDKHEREIINRIKQAFDGAF
jgi:hypothetical protein